MVGVSGGSVADSECTVGEGSCTGGEGGTAEDVVVIGGQCNSQLCEHAISIYKNNLLVHK